MWYVCCVLRGMFSFVVRVVPVVCVVCLHTTQNKHNINTHTHAHKHEVCEWFVLCFVCVVFCVCCVCCVCCAVFHSIIKT